ncbi:MAG: Gp49 family protein [Sarcina sp.]
MPKSILTIKMEELNTVGQVAGVGRIEFEIRKNTITKEHVESMIQEKIVKTEEKFGKPMTVVDVLLTNGMVITETSTCVDPKNYKQEYGEEDCMKRIYDKLWFALGFALSCGNMNFTEVEN